MPRAERAHRAAPAPVQVIAVTGGKGGTGKTSVAVNLATALAQMGRKTMLLDGDLGLANVDVLLGLTPRYTLEHVLARRAHARGGDSRDRRGRARGAGRVRRGAHGRPEPRPSRPASCRPSARCPDRSHVLIVDTAAGIAESVLQFCQAAQQVLVVLRDEPTSLTDTYALIKLLSRDRGVRQFRVRHQPDAPGGTGRRSLFGACNA